jgi:hypothetical protein
MPIMIILSASMFLILLVLLHFIKREFDPSWRMISEYEIGCHGWLMRIAFICLSVSCYSLVVFLWQRVSLAGEIILIIAGTGTLGAAIFAADPITMPRNEVSTVGGLHTMFGVFFIIGFPIAVTVIGWHVTDPSLDPIKAWLPWMSVAVWLGWVIFMGSTIVFGRGGVRNEHVKIGWPNRLMMLINAAYLIIIGTKLI